ncbi:hypothetical protein GCM10007147_35820 [Nocardiopsis kunsanensis]|uniref:Peptidase M50 domain-containing protein n=1 Tax=Nocardiopsis kunsanensis TaxID=141693 RepID=A0A919CKF9_9ACTN|nr:M50 family metallopeptidase [Nocardiopsis kunsanensis]GHD32338.1 hypothetical protein GCM10007147_35820 [Nocardiopsis kunsanensis]
MIAGNDPADARPRIREDIVVGPALIRGSRPIHVIKDPVSERMMTVGAREHFIISRLDGHHSLADITAEYGAEFGRRLDERAWGGVMSTLAGRSLLEGSPPPKAAEPDAGSGPTLLNARIELLRPGPWLEHTAARVAWAFSPVFVLIAMAAAMVACATVALNLGPLFGTATQVWSDPWTGAPALVVLWGVVALHELGHGLAAVRFGARVRDFGIAWRFPLIAPYCAVEEVQVLPSRDRVRIAFAGVFVSLLVLPVALLLWLLAPEGSGLYTFASVLLLFGTFAALINFVPFLKLDGYSMLNHALGTENLARDARSHVLGRLRARFGGAEQPPSPPRPIGFAYVTYATSSVLFHTALTAVLAAWWFTFLDHLIGPWTAAGLLAATAVAIIAVYRTRAVRRRAASDTRHRSTGKEGT